MRDYHRAGYPNGNVYKQHVQTVYETLEKLHERFGHEVEVAELAFFPASEGSTAYYRQLKINIGMRGLLYWTTLGYAEYCTLQYLIGLKWKRGEPQKRSRWIIGERAVVATLGHEFAHLLSYKRYGIVKGKNHGIMFQATVAEVYDFLFGDDFGATDRFLKRKGEQWLEATAQ